MADPLNLVDIPNFMPANLPSLSQAERTAFTTQNAILRQWQVDPRFKDLLVFESVEERDDFFGPELEREVGMHCLVDYHDGVHPVTYWIWDRHVTASGNQVPLWKPFDLAWRDFEPGLNNMTLGNGNAIGRVMRMGVEAQYEFAFVMGSTSAMGSGPAFDLLWNGVDTIQGFGNGGPMGMAFCRQAGANTLAFAIYADANFNSALAQYWNTAGGRVFNASITAALPNAWADGNRLIITNFTHELDIENIVFTD
jgi:hypothetical protein